MNLMKYMLLVYLILSSMPAGYCSYILPVLAAALCYSYNYIILLLVYTTTHLLLQLYTTTTTTTHLLLLLYTIAGGPLLLLVTTPILLLLTTYYSIYYYCFLATLLCFGQSFGVDLKRPKDLSQGKASACCACSLPLYPCL